MLTNTYINTKKTETVIKKTVPSLREASPKKPKITWGDQAKSQAVRKGFVKIIDNQKISKSFLSKPPSRKESFSSIVKGSKKLFKSHTSSNLDQESTNTPRKPTESIVTDDFAGFAKSVSDECSPLMPSPIPCQDHRTDLQVPHRRQGRDCSNHPTPLSREHHQALQCRR